MAEKTKHCPQCGGMMNFRLGEFQCGSCDYTEAQAPAANEAPRAGRAPLWQRPSPGGQAAQIPPPSAFGAGSEPSPLDATRYGYGADSGAMWQERTPEYSDSLINEKHVYFAVCAILTLLSLVSNGLTGAMFGSQAASGAQMPPGFNTGAMIGGSIFMQGLVLLVTWWVLYSKEVWAKWTCIGCTGLYLAFLVLGMFGLMSLLSISSTVNATPGMGFLKGVLIFMVLVYVAWFGWFISILYRDARQLS